ncbi:hypothetical protein CC1G_00529 [Coprinopsis cinerea okayama7|uniref:Ribonuclease H n=1 Tax=Coprinopsis cinerea (strain Okayama-7 / 130 / ATCC MYA-4618 / FGSC 9003) TaxID=240176 RepID=A8N3A5_COPC7|nr:hypothetical protein CC1G_00529 [Coprinopsis cinerea okayama7\|eukprot:XP_001829350.2 hypothetical protein CC1G_00529 [Coprinopsis cinerea okayama7\
MAPKSKTGFYAVKSGRVPGVYSTWTECENQVKGFAGAQYKKFNTHDEATSFVAGEAVSAPAATSSKPPSSSGSSGDKGKKRGASLMLTGVEDESEWLVVYTDGASKGNGQPGSVAGIGVWWGHDDPRNIAERCPGDQTNNRAELLAILRVLETAPISKTPLLIKSDSQYSMNCLQVWLPGWVKRGWKNAKGEPVKNAPIIRLISAHLDRRAQLGQKVRMVYVEGHSGNVGNDGADAQANAGCLLPPTEERDWDAEEKELRATMASHVPSTTVVAEGNVLEVAPDPFTAAPQKRPRIKSPQPVSEGSSSRPVIQDVAPPESPAKANRLAAINDALKDQHVRPQVPRSPSKGYTRGGSTAVSSSNTTTADSPEKRNRIAAIQSALAGASSDTPPQGSSGGAKSVAAPESPSKSRLAAIQDAFASPVRPASSHVSPSKPRFKPPSSAAPTSQRSLSTIADESQPRSPAPPNSVASPTPRNPAKQGSGSTPSMTVYPSPVKSPLRVLYVSPLLIPGKDKPPPQIDFEDYADCFDDEFAKDLDD